MSSSIELSVSQSSWLSPLNYIDGNWLHAASAEYIEVFNPATGAIVAVVPDSSDDDALLALDAAYDAFQHWRKTDVRTRSNLLREWHRLIVENTEDLAILMSLEQGKPLAEARGEVAYGASYVLWYAEEALRLSGTILPNLLGDRQQRVRIEPVGVVACITPWNFPLAIIARKIAPALAAGCTVVAKPSEETPLTALALADLAHRAGIPKGVLNMVVASRENTPVLVKAWLDDPRVRKISFTGSTAVGKYLAKESAQTLKRLSLELGGNAPFIVFDSAQIDVAVSALLQGKFRNGGQTCICPNRVFVQESVYEAFCSALVAKVESLKCGPATQVDAEIGPMINAKAIQKIDSHIDSAKTGGARVLCGGFRLSGADFESGHFYCPTVLVDVPKGTLFCHEETFGPVVPVFKFKSEEDVVAEANSTPYGLAAYFCSEDYRQIERVAASLDVGVVGINTGIVASEAAPFGGVKESGYGREGSKQGLLDYCDTKYLCQSMT
jgi:succinate-semialdehyde dehydrogenase/glutarate-semialdehyde dehydrogenase